MALIKVTKIMAVEMPGLKIIKNRVYWLLCVDVYGGKSEYLRYSFDFLKRLIVLRGKLFTIIIVRVLHA